MHIVFFFCSINISESETAMVQNLSAFLSLYFFFFLGEGSILTSTLPVERLSHPVLKHTMCTELGSICAVCRYIVAILLFFFCIYQRYVLLHEE